MKTKVTLQVEYDPSNSSLITIRRVNRSGDAVETFVLGKGGEIKRDVLGRFVQEHVIDAVLNREKRKRKARPAVRQQRMSVSDGTYEGHLRSIRAAIDADDQLALMTYPPEEIEQAKRL